jgi:hypothetical protein
MMTTTGQDQPARLLSAAVRVLPAGRRDWGLAMQAELTAVTQRSDRWVFTLGCLRATAAELHVLRGAVHLLVVLGTLGTLLAWTATVDYPPLAWILSAMVSVLAAMCWEARRAGMLGPTGDGGTAWVLRGCGYLACAGIIAVAAARVTGLLVVATMAAGFLIGLATVCARRSAATARVLVTGAGSGLAATVIWLVTVAVAPPIPVSVGWALALTGVAAVGAVLANSGASGTNPGCLLAGLLATAGTMALIFAGVVALAHWGPDGVIPDVTPHALPADRVAESRIEIVDPYVLLLVLGAVASTALSLVAVVTRRPVADGPPGGSPARR